MRAQRDIATIIRARRFELLDATGFVVGAWVSNEPIAVYPQTAYRLRFASPEWIGDESAQLGFHGDANDSRLLLEATSDTDARAYVYALAVDDASSVEMFSGGDPLTDPGCRIETDISIDDDLAVFNLVSAEGGGGAFARVRGSINHPSFTDGVEILGSRITLGTAAEDLRAPPAFAITSASTTNLIRVGGSGGQFQRSTSRRADKRDIEPIERRYWRELLELPVYWYRSRLPADRPDWSNFGIMAEDAERVDPRLAAYDESVTPSEECPDVRPPPIGTNYVGMVAPLIALCQEQEQRIAALENTVRELADRLTSDA